ncbi:MAG: hypothetical protein ACREVJ_04755 [Gammaproteobacteria bacterium]
MGEAVDLSRQALGGLPMSDEIKTLFRDVLLVCDEMRLIGNSSLPSMGVNFLSEPS